MKQKKRPSVRIVSVTLKRGSSPCPSCNKMLDGVTGALFEDRNFGTRPELTGKTTICCYCAALLVFTDNDGHVRPMTDDEQRAHKTAMLLPGNEILRGLYDDVRATAQPVADYTKARWN